MHMELCEKKNVLNTIPRRNSMSILNVRKSLGSVRLFLKKEINTFIQQGHIKLIKSDSKDIYNVTKDVYF